MHRWLAEKLGNVSVNHKLGVGFGLVLLLTLLITFTGWTGLGDVASRGDKLGYISSLNVLTKDLRIARLVIAPVLQRRRDAAFAYAILNAHQKAAKISPQMLFQFRHILPPSFYDP